MTVTKAPERAATPPRRRPPLRAVLLVALVAALVLSGLGLLVNTAILSRSDDRAAGTGKVPQVEIDLKAPSRRPELRAEGRQPTEAGATAFTLFWFDALNYSLANADTDLLAGHTGAGCRQCSGYLIGLARWKEQGAKLDGGLSVPVDLAIGPFSTTEPVQFAATFLTTPATVTQKDGSAQDYPGGRTRGAVTVLWANERWQMTDLVIDVKQAGPGS